MIDSQCAILELCDPGVRWLLAGQAHELAGMGWDYLRLDFDAESANAYSKVPRCPIGLRHGALFGVSIVRIYTFGDNPSDQFSLHHPTTPEQ